MPDVETVGIAACEYVGGRATQAVGDQTSWGKVKDERNSKMQEDGLAS